MATAVEIEIASLNPGIQVRDAQTDQETVLRYAEAFDGGAVFPPIMVARLPDGRLVPWDGNHRIAAYRFFDEARIPAIVEDMSEAEARWRALGSGRAHALNLTRAEKRRIATEAIRTRPTMTDTAIALHTGFSQSFIGQVRAELAVQEPEVEPGTRLVRSRNGGTHVQAKRGKAGDLHRKNKGSRRQPPTNLGPSKADEAEVAAQRQAYLALHLPLTHLSMTGGNVAGLLARMSPEQRLIIVKLIGECEPIMAEAVAAIRPKAAA